MGAQELFEIVDSEGIPTGDIVSREIAHRDGLRHRVTQIWIVNRNKEVLCQQRSLLKDSDPGKWQSFFWGHLTSGQTFSDNAISELQEELGISLRAEDFIPIYVRHSERSQHVTQVYLVWYGGDTSFSCPDGEVIALEWIAFELLENRLAEGDFCNTMDLVVKKRILGEI